MFWSHCAMIRIWIVPVSGLELVTFHGWSANLPFKTWTFLFQKTWKLHPFNCYSTSVPKCIGFIGSMLHANWLKLFILDKTWYATTTKMDTCKGFWVTLTDSQSSVTCGAPSSLTGSATGITSIRNTEEFWPETETVRCTGLKSSLTA